MACQALTLTLELIKSDHHEDIAVPFLSDIQIDTSSQQILVNNFNSYPFVIMLMFRIDKIL